MSARDEILARVRSALAGAPAPPPVSRDYRRTGTADRAELVARFADRVADYRADVHRVPAAELAEAVARTLTRTATLVVPADLPPAWLAGYRGPVRREEAPIPVTELDAPGVSVLTGCAVAIAETGTIVLDAGPAQGRRALTLVPDHHVCVVRADQIAATVPEALARLADPTRPLTFISGPSATSDIELDRVEGVHGPRTLDVIITE
ncbi:MAG TPA: LUD domain-containing protein [Natronosporangium sp.]